MPWPLWDAGPPEAWKEAVESASPWGEEAPREEREERLAGEGLAAAAGRVERSRARGARRRRERGIPGLNPCAQRVTSPRK
jgi:hypothetical protein